MWARCEIYATRLYRWLLIIKIERSVRNYSCKSPDSRDCPRSCKFIESQGKTVGLFSGLLISHGILNSLSTRHLAQLTKGFVFVNLGSSLGPSLCELGVTIADIARQLSLLLFWRWHPTCILLIMFLEQQVSLTKQGDGIPELHSYSAFFLSNGLYVSAFHISGVIYSELL